MSGHSLRCQQGTCSASEMSKPVRNAVSQALVSKQLKGDKWGVSARGWHYQSAV